MVESYGNGGKTEPGSGIYNLSVRLMIYLDGWMSSAKCTLP